MDQKKISQIDLQDPQTLSNLKEEAKNLIVHRMYPEAWYLANRLEEVLGQYSDWQTSQPQLLAGYSNVLIALKLLSVSLYNEAKMLKIIKEHLASAFDIGIDMEEALTIKLYGTPDLIWPEVAERIIETMKQNIQPIGQNPILLRGEKTPASPIIVNWLADFDRNFGPEKQSGLIQLQYLGQNANALKLSESDKNKLKQLLILYNDLKPLAIPKEIEERLNRLAGTAGAAGQKEPNNAVPAAGESMADFSHPKMPPSPPPIKIASPMSPDKYREPVNEPPPSAFRAKIEGNIVDLKNQSPKP